MTQLDYETPSVNDRIDWRSVLVILLAGIPVGVAVAFTYTAMALFGAVGSLIIGGSACYMSRSRAFSHAAWGGTVVGGSTMLLTIAGDWWVGNRVRDVVVVSFVFVPIVFTLPGVLGGAVVRLARRRAG